MCEIEEHSMEFSWGYLFVYSDIKYTMLCKEPTVEYIYYIYYKYLHELTYMFTITPVASNAATTYHSLHQV